MCRTQCYKRHTCGSATPNAKSQSLGTEPSYILAFIYYLFIIFAGHGATQEMHRKVLFILDF
jgi:hypothetical protein